MWSRVSGIGRHDRGRGERGHVKEVSGCEPGERLRSHLSLSLSHSLTPPFLLRSLKYLIRSVGLF